MNSKHKRADNAKKNEMDWRKDESIKLVIHQVNQIEQIKVEILNLKIKFKNILIIQINSKTF